MDVHFTARRLSPTNELYLPNDSDDDLHSSASSSPPVQSRSKDPQLTYFDAFALLISLQIGSGIFSSPSQIDKHAPGPGYAIIVWIVSGFLAWAGAACYAELGSALPLSGGTQEYLKYIFGDGLAFMASWIWIIAVKPSGMAALTITFGQYWMNVIFDSAVADDGWQTKLTAIIGFALMVFLNMSSVHATTRMTSFFLALKMFTLFLLLLSTGFYLCFRSTPTDEWRTRNWFSITNTAWNSQPLSGVGECTIALYAGLWAYAGWDNVNMVAGDVRNPSRDIPRAIHTAQPVVISSFVLANVCYYIIVPWTEIKTTNSIAVTVGSDAFGRLGGLTFAILVSLACLGSVNVNVFTTSRLVVSAAQAGWLPRPLEKFGSIYSTKNFIRPDANQTPIRAMLFNFCLTLVYIAFGTFSSLITFIGLAEYIFFSAATIGLLVLRFREPQLPRPYKTNIMLPIIFAAASVFLVIFGSIQAPTQALLLVGMIAAGLARKSEMGRIIREFLSGKKRRGRYQNLSLN